MKIHKYAIVEKGAKIGKGTTICSFCFIEKGVIIGKNCKIKNGVQIFDGVEIGDSVFIAPGVIFTNTKRPYASITQRPYRTTIVEDYASIGANATILSGLRIGSHAMIGAGSVVTKDIPPGITVYGNPAR